ncbi:hypothetical protein LINGRAHAP2_LOCUS7175 [Linum grandiflorum]
MAEGLLTFGIREMMELLIFFSIIPEEKKEETARKSSGLIRVQYFWKKLLSKPSEPRD